MNGQTVNQQRKVSEKDMAWLAGIWDGEGSIGIKVQKAHPHGRHMYIAPYAQLVNSHQATLDKVHQVLSDMEVGHHISWAKIHGAFGNRDTAHYKPLWKILISGLKRCQTLLTILRPYLVTKKEEADAVWAFIESRGDNHYSHLPYTDYEWELTNRFRHRNHKGRLTEPISVEALKSLKSLNDYTLSASCEGAIV